MKKILSNAMLGGAALIFAIGATLHAYAYWSKIRVRIENSNLPPFLAAEIRALWLADSTTLMALAIILGYILAKPATVPRAFILLLAVVPAGTTLLLYFLLGSFYAAHLLAAATVMVVVAGLMIPVAIKPR